MTMAASFEAKVEALRKLREKRLAVEHALKAERSLNQRTETQDAQPDDSVPDTIQCQIKAEAQDTKGVAPVPVECRQLDFAQQGTKPEPGGIGGAGEQDALFCTAHCYERGLHGCEQDYAMAAHFYRLAAEGGHAVAQWRFGELLEFGRGVDKNDAEAMRWYKLAAEAGNMHAQAGLALLLEEGRGAAVDNVEALRWHLAAAENGHTLSQYCVAVSFIEGRGTKQDMDVAQHWLQRSADGGFPTAISMLADFKIYEKSTKAAQDPVPSLEGRSMLEIAERFAEQLDGYDDADVEFFIDELMARPEDDEDDDFDDDADDDGVHREHNSDQEHPIDDCSDEDEDSSSDLADLRRDTGHGETDAAADAGVALQFKPAPRSNDNSSLELMHGQT